MEMDVNARGAMAMVCPGMVTCHELACHAMGCQVMSCQSMPWTAMIGNRLQWTSMDSDARVQNTTKVSIKTHLISYSGLFGFEAIGRFPFNLKTFS